MLGTSTSGQAARTLNTEAGIDSATLASLLWRLDHHQLTLDPHTVVVLDEAAMTADADLLRLAVGIERAGAKLVLVGDQRQLSAIGPGGAIDAVLERHPEIVTVLADNVRQHDPAERLALAELRAGSVPAAVDWFARAGRTTTAPTRTEALVEMVDQWAHDIDAGHHTALLAWRRQDVTDLNRLARARYDQLGHLHGDDLIPPGGRRYAVGDRVVTLAPNPAAQLVTSQQLTVTAVDHDTQTLTVQTDDGRSVASDRDAHRPRSPRPRLRPHRPPRPRRHLRPCPRLRRRRRTRARLRRHEPSPRPHHPPRRRRRPPPSHRRPPHRLDPREPPTLDHRHPGHHRCPAAQPVTDAAAHHERLRQERAELEALAPPDPTDKLQDTRYRVRALRQDLDDLPYGAGRWRDTEIGDAARDKIDAERQHRQADDFARSATCRSGRATAGARPPDNGAPPNRSHTRYDELAAPIQRHSRPTSARPSSSATSKPEPATRAMARTTPELELRIAAIDRELDPIPPSRTPLALEIEPPSHGLGLGLEL